MVLPNLDPGGRQELSTGEIKQQETVSVKQLVFYLVFTWIIIVAILVLFYMLLFVRSVNRTVAENYREWSGDSSNPSEWKTQTTSDVDSNALGVLEAKLLEDPVFTQLKNVQVEIPLEPIGKSNPFVPYAPPPSEKFVLPDGADSTIIIEENNLPQLE
jgi:cytoskeletal protein RodZ